MTDRQWFNLIRLVLLGLVVFAPMLKVIPLGLWLLLALAYSMAAVGLVIRGENANGR